jgi:hypothetical protein
MRAKKAVHTKGSDPKSDAKKSFLGNYWQYNNWGDKDDLYRYIQSFPDHAEGYRRRNTEELPNLYDRFDSGGDYYGQR